MQYIFNHRALENSDSIPLLTKDRIFFHINNKTKWEIMFTQNKKHNVIAREEAYGNSFSVIDVPISCLSPEWADEEFE